ncbi:MlaD family protein, partial [Williamsia sterculiae]
MNMISRLQIRQLIVLAVLALVTLTYTGIHYARLGSAVGIGEYTVRAVFPDSGGIFTDAEVTYQGVAVGRVSALRLTNAGVDVDLRLKTGAARVPAASTAVVADRSAVGEQFVDLRPTSAAGPFLHEGSVITDVAIPPPLD